MSRVPFAVAVLAAYGASEAAYSDEYSWELSGFASEAEQGPALDSKRSSLQATYFFDPVEDTSGPYALAAFFDPSTRVSVTASREERDVNVTSPGPVATAPGFIDETGHYAVSGRYVLPRSKWYFGGSYIDSDVEMPPSSALQAADSTGYGLLVGKYLGAATTLEIALDSSEDDGEYLFAVCILGQACVNAGIATTELQRDHARIDVLHVRRFRSMTYSLSGRIAQSKGHLEIQTPAFTLPLPLPLPLPPFFGPAPPDVTIPANTFELSLPRLRTYFVGGELFPTAKLGVRVSYARWDDDTPIDDAYDVAATWFFRRNVGIQFVLARQTADDRAAIVFDPDLGHVDTATIRVIGRL